MHKTKYINSPKWLTELRLRIVELRGKRAELEKKLMNPYKMKAGALNVQYRTCGKSNCKCMDKENPKKHGPYHYVMIKEDGKVKQKYVKDEEEIGLVKAYQEYMSWIKEHTKTNKEIKLVFEQIKEKGSHGRKA